MVLIYSVKELFPLRPPLVLLDVQSCRLQAIYSPITGKNFVTLYTAFDPWNRGNQSTIEITGNSPVIVLKSVISISGVKNVFKIKALDSYLKYFVINSTGKISVCL